MTEIDVRNVVIECLEDIGILIDLSSDDDVNLTEYSVDSISFISFIVALEEKLGIIIPDDLLLIDILQSMNGFINLIEELILNIKSDKL